MLKKEREQRQAIEMLCTDIPVAAKRYQEQLDEEIEADRAAHGKKPLKKDEKKDDDTQRSTVPASAPGKEKTVVGSSTDPESGLFHKGEHRKCFAYEAHTVCDRRGYVLETEITPGNVHDSVAFDTVFERLRIMSAGSSSTSAV